MRIHRLLRRGILLAKSVRQSIEEDGIDGAGSAIHCVLDDRNNPRDEQEGVVAELATVKLIEDRLGTPLQTDAAVAVTYNCVVSCYFCFACNEFVEGAGKDFLGLLGVHC